MRSFLIASVFIAFAFTNAFAQMPGAIQDTTVGLDALPKEKLPIEIELLYDKLRHQVPDYDDMIRQAHILKGQQFGEDALFAQQRTALQGIYERSGPGQLFIVKRHVTVAAVDDVKRLASLERIEPDQPILFENLSGQKFGVFIVNGDAASQMAPPYEYEDFPALLMNFQYQKTDLPADITVNPIDADPKDFTLADGEQVKVILAEMTEIDLDYPDENRVILHKKLKTLPPKEPDSLSDLFKGTAGGVSATPLPTGR